MAVIEQPTPPQYVAYLTGQTGSNVGALNTRKDPKRIGRDDLAGSQNAWLTPLGVIGKRPGIANFGGGSISAITNAAVNRTPTTPLAGCQTLRFNGVTYVVVQDSIGHLFVFPKYTGNTNWFHIGGAFSPAVPLTNNPAQMFDPTTNVIQAFMLVSPGNTSPVLYSGVITTFSVGTAAGANTVITPTGMSLMSGIYVNLFVSLSGSTANFETQQVTVVTGTTFTVAATANNHNAGDFIVGIVDSVSIALPRKFFTNTSITPKYTDTLFSNLFYANDPSAPTAVYTSDPYFPQSFTSNYFQSTIYPGTYQPALVGHNDGVNGGDITGIRRLGTQMMVYKQSAIYSLSLVSLYGDMVWQVQIVSPSIGCVSPNSIVSFDTFHVFLGIDGLYITDGVMVRRIDMNVPTFFDSSGTFTGTPTIGNHTNATAARFGSVYLIMYDDGAGFPDRGLWFDFEQTDAQNYPLCGEITFNASVGSISGLCSMRGPSDTGSVFVCSASNNLTGEFAQSGATNPGDFGFNIAWSITLKADQFEDYPVDGAIAAHKIIERLIILGQTVFNVGQVTVSVSINGGNPVMSNAVIFATNTDGLVRETMSAPLEVTFDRALLSAQIALSESSAIPFTISGIIAELSVPPVVAT